MKNVKMLVNTIYDGPIKAGEIIAIPDDYAERWNANGIATILGDSDIVDSEEPDEEESDSHDEEEVTQEFTKEDYEKMSGKELFALCKGRGLEVEAKQPKAVYIDALMA